ncbi:hypothetical protein PHYBLDRAFT_141443 [Phycomyces blakesleeanus NRRL 1555(-)]|uniref:Uncharacterized protein n=1 Tax=Phycomyces blakesleeanus (strain ATCC 8743b / DSM 1359 / FGSC 10004 / NBRC 33097 / NRRL 1555) TaxID=763407 RepID=A0A162UR56_PHYB8|nr:hypothetical protein PHYBLDRAFT_141443 [Phycomyces blakesleeanus NRRL 1555(-)]OAD77562.1 hypothetical protein PHYBLDRAFT_141443 [Phycomyces blakesleeanus NRRL 1555(-)]|eukprot:XP_018295602.1 hypothetical protein PHYBLDRAFT_141443 [Phycomyces blakesleeanus NRRL 1555(-)]
MDTRKIWTLSGEGNVIVIIPIFKNFGVMAGSLSGSWRLDRDVYGLPMDDFRVPGINRKLLDGILTNEAKTLAIMLESSRSEDIASHNIDDTYKQLKST